jgi:hypothetical protein
VELPDADLHEAVAATGQLKAQYEEMLRGGADVSFDTRWEGPESEPRAIRLPDERWGYRGPEQQARLDQFAQDMAAKLLLNF